MTQKIQDFVEFISVNVEHVGLREALIGRARSNQLPVAWELLARYLAAGEEGKVDIEMFHEPMVDSDLTGSEYMDTLVQAADNSAAGNQATGNQAECLTEQEARALIIETLMQRIHATNDASLTEALDIMEGAWRPDR